MSDLYHEEFVDRLCDGNMAEEHQDPDDPFWDQFWLLKPATKKPNP